MKMSILKERSVSTEFCCLHSLTRIQSKGAPKARAKKEEKVFLEIDARFERPNTRGGRGRGDRGGERGGRGTRDRGRSQRSNGSGHLNVNDEAAFPSLSGA